MSKIKKERRIIMRKRFKKIITAAVTATMLMSMGIPASAVNNDVAIDETSASAVYMEEVEKTDFAQEMDKVYANAVAKGKILKTSESEIDSLLEEVTFATGTERERLKDELADCGVYIYETERTSANVQPLSQTADVNVLAPTIAYEAALKEWTVTCGGNWKNGNWNEAVVNGNIGGVDAFGVGYTNTSGTYNSYVVDAMAYITDQNQTETVRTDVRSDGDGQKGFGFRLQDYKNNNKYVGYKWYGSCTYDYRFGSYSGIATGYYVHTYSKGNITNVSFGLNGTTAGVGFDISNKDYSFPAYGNDTPFGVY